MELNKIIETYFAVMWGEVQKQLPRSIERAALGDAKIATAMKLAFIQVIPVILNNEKKKFLEAEIERKKNLPCADVDPQDWGYKMAIEQDIQHLEEVIKTIQ